MSDQFSAYRWQSALNYSTAALKYSITGVSNWSSVQDKPVTFKFQVRFTSR